MDPLTIAAATSLVSSLIGGWQSSKAAQKGYESQKDNLEAKRQMYQDWYNKEYNTDPLQRTSAQRILGQTRDLIRERNKQANATAAVVGGTNASLAATRQANANTMSNTINNIYENTETRRNNVENTYLTQQGNYYDSLGTMEANRENQRAKNISQAAQAVGTAANQWASSYDEKTTTQKKTGN